MNEITMIPVDQLIHHPQNPRLDLGDLTELTESIRSQGVLQNLTVVPGAEFPGDDHYLVVIGNRRMEAAKLAGLAEVPCVISNMDYNTQIATMLTENMHRADLTLYEQAQGIQMMMDLGLSQGQISEMTGFSRSTIKRRAEMAKLDKETLKEKCKQLTMDDIDKLMKVKDLDKRNKLLKEAGTSNLKWHVDQAITEQKREENYQLIRGILLQAGCIEKGVNGVTDFWQKYEYLAYSSRISLDNYAPGANVLPENNRQLFFFKDYSTVTFWAEKRKEPAAEDEEEPEELSEEEIAKRAEAEEVRKAWEKLNDIEQRARKSRDEFIKTMTIKQKDNRKALNWILISLAIGDFDAWASLIPDSDEEEDDELAYSLKWMRDQIDTNPVIVAEVLNKVFFDDVQCIRNKWRTEVKPVYDRNLSMITGYEWLADFGYQISDDERAYLDGTLDCFKEVAEG